MISAATKGAHRDSRGSPTARSSHSASRASTSLRPSRSHSRPRWGQVSFLSFIETDFLSQSRTHGPARRFRVRRRGPGPEYPGRGHCCAHFSR